MQDRLQQAFEIARSMYEKIGGRASSLHSPAPRGKSLNSGTVGTVRVPQTRTTSGVESGCLCHVTCVLLHAIQLPHVSTLPTASHSK